MSSKAIYKALWAFIMVTDSICSSIYTLITYIHAVCVALYCSLITRNRLKNDVEYLEECKNYFKKIPKHLNVIIASKNISLDTLSNLAFYALILDIDYISYYDVNGTFKLDEADIPKCINSQKMQNGRLLWSMSGDKKTSAMLKYKNGLEKSIEVVVLSPNDGKPALADVCREMYEKRKSADICDALHDRIALENIINSALQKRLDNLPEPELSVILDGKLCTYGVLPWHTRFTEFHCIEKSKSFNVETFVDIMYKFSKCEQRFGK